MDRFSIDALARALASKRSRRQMVLSLFTLSAGGAGAALLTGRSAATKPTTPIDCTLLPETCLCGGLGDACSTFADCCDGGSWNGAGPHYCVDGTCQCCHAGDCFCGGKYFNVQICHDPTKTLGLCCVDAADCSSPDASCVWVGCTPGVDPDCNPNFPFPCPRGYEFVIGSDPIPRDYCDQFGAARRRPKRRKGKRRATRRRR